MLFGDWGTSRLYVLGLAFFYTQHAALWFMLAMSVLLLWLGWAYSIISRIYPDGGGVYSAARHRSQTLAVVGGLLLCADYLVTAAISTLDGFHYLNVASPAWWAAASILAIGVTNYFGPKKAGTAALVIALLTVLLTLVVALFAVPELPEARVTRPAGPPIRWWAQFTTLILAISGVEAIANMTGIMVRPVEQTAKWAIWPVLCEIVVLNIVLTAAMLAVPEIVLGNGDPNRAFVAHRDDMLRAMAAYYVGPGFAAAASFVFTLLLISAANTAVSDLISIQFMMSRDGELPGIFGALNHWGMPLLPLLVATAAPLVVLLSLPDVGALADLYAIGVVGAVAINLGSTSTDPTIAMRSWERRLMQVLAVILVAVWITIAVEKPRALVFAATVLAIGLGARYVVHHRAELRRWILIPSPVLPTPAAPAVALPSAAAGPVRLGRLMVATHGNMKLFRFALAEAKVRGAELLLLFVRHIAIPTMGPSNVAEVALDPEAQAVFNAAETEAKQAGVKLFCLYAVAWDVPDAILEFAVTYGSDTLILGASQRGALWHAMKGDVIQTVAQYLPENISLLIHA
jgi:amino acid transporter